MKLVTYEPEGEAPRAGVLEGDRGFEIGADLRALLAGGVAG